MASVRNNEMFRNALFDSDLLDQAIEWIREHLQVEEVFNESELQQWAEDNGYTLTVSGE